MKNKMFSKILAMMLFVITVIGAVPVHAATSDTVEAGLQEAIMSISFDINDRVKHEKTIVLEDGTEATVGAEPIETGERALSGTWRIYGYNPLATMEYYIVLAPSGSYTTISNTYGLAISGALTSFENEKITVVTKTETSSQSAIVEGYAKFHYLGNQWVSIWTQSGGVRATIKNDVITTALY